jgi:chorismate mutase
VSSIDDLRTRIDALDLRLVELLNQRAACALEVGEVKRALGLDIYQPEREAQVLQNVHRWAARRRSAHSALRAHHRRSTATGTRIGVRPFGGR